MVDERGLEKPDTKQCDRISGAIFNGAGGGVVTPIQSAGTVGKPH